VAVAGAATGAATDGAAGDFCRGKGVLSESRRRGAQRTTCSS